jgi:hypothetical protein
MDSSRTVYTFDRIGSSKLESDARRPTECPHPNALESAALGARAGRGPLGAPTQVDLVLYSQVGTSRRFRTNAYVVMSVGRLAVQRSGRRHSRAPYFLSSRSGAALSRLPGYRTR